MLISPLLPEEYTTKNGLVRSKCIPAPLRDTCKGNWRRWGNNTHKIASSYSKFSTTSEVKTVSHTFEISTQLTAKLTQFKTNQWHKEDRDFSSHITHLLKNLERSSTFLHNDRLNKRRVRSQAVSCNYSGQGMLITIILVVFLYQESSLSFRIVYLFLSDERVIQQRIQLFFLFFFGRGGGR